MGLFQSCRGGRFYWWRKLEYPEKPPTCRKSLTNFIEVWKFEIKKIVSTKRLILLQVTLSYMYQHAFRHYSTPGITATRNVGIQKFKQYILVLFKVLAMDRHNNVTGLYLLMESLLLIIRVNENM